MKKETKKLSKRKLILIVIGIIILSVVGFFVFKKSQKEKPEKTEIQRGEVVEELVLSGEVDATEYAQLYFPVSGKIIWVGVSEGDEVKKGQALSKLDTISLNSAYQRARADLRAAEASFEKARDDVKNHSSDETFAQKETRTTYEAAKDKAYEAVLIAEQNLKDATLVSPFGGIVTYIANPFAGVNILFSQKQIEVLNPKTIYFEVTADQNEVMKIKKGQEVVIVLDSYSDKNIPGVVDFVSLAPKEGESGTVYKVSVTFNEGSIEELSQIRVGMSGDAKFILSKKEDVLYLPGEYIGSDVGGKYIKLGTKNNKVYVDIGIENEEKTEIIEKDSSGKLKEGLVVYD